MGMAVFATYHEGMTDHFAQESTADGDGVKGTKNIEGVSIPQHFFAGGLGGVSHSILSLVLVTKLQENSW
jgi:hypothetical protein